MADEKRDWGFYGESPHPIDKHPIFQPNDEDRARIKTLVRAEWLGRELNPLIPIDDIVTDAYYATLRLLREKFG